jgi:surface polysaccharide O-acyltransferase-like enzyme
MILYFEGKPLGFNELCKKAQKLFNFSRPTLSAHLKHLIGKGLIIKEIEKKGKLTLKSSKYTLNWNIAGYVPTFNQSKAEKWELLTIKKDFKNLAWYLYDDFATLCLLTLKYHLETMINKKDAEKGLWLSQISLAIFTESLYHKIQTILKNAKEEEISELLTEWDTVIENLKQFAK